MSPEARSTTWGRRRRSAPRPSPVLPSRREEHGTAKRHLTPDPQLARCADGSARRAFTISIAATRLLCLYQLPRFALKYLQIKIKWRADERTRTADLTSLRVIIQALQGFAEACISRISKRFSLLRVALCCTVLRSRWCQYCPAACVACRPCPGPFNRSGATG
jgi:hypothetical protein